MKLKDFEFDHTEYKPIHSLLYTELHHKGEGVQEQLRNHLKGFDNHPLPILHHLIIIQFMSFIPIPNNPTITLIIHTSLISLS